MHNTRDLYGFPVTISNSNNKEDHTYIAPQKIIRSGELSGISGHDADYLLNIEKLSRVIDFRTDYEVKRTPIDKKVLPYVEYVQLPVFTENGLGITHEKSIIANICTAKALVSDMIHTVENTYRNAITSEQGQYAYQEFFRVMLEPTPGSTLLNCSAGKDRTGLAAIFIERALGGSIKDIRADYMATNIFSVEKNSHFPHSIFSLITKLGLNTDPFFYVYDEYFSYVMDLFDQDFGGIDRYIRDVLNVSDDERRQLQKMYLAE